MEDAFDIEDEFSWPAWDIIGAGHDLATSLSDSLQNHGFTTIQDQELPLASHAVVDVATKSPNEVKREAVAFSIMARNLNVLNDLVNEDYKTVELKEIFQFHLTTTFMDGSRTCCGIIWHLLNFLDDEDSISANYVDQNDMTVLDSLFASILRSHTNITPDILQPIILGITKHRRFPGADVDICSRWDADSPCIRHLHAPGEVHIPPKWKHMFCHTSVQAVCHTITAIFMYFWRPNINTHSGLFRRRCACGLQLTLGPLHALVFTAFHLSQSGLPGETLFGMVACLVCLLTVRADPLLAVDVSVEAILMCETPSECRHRRLNAAELARCIPEYVVNSWTQDVQLGWRTFVEILDYAVGSRFEVLHSPTRPSTCGHLIHQREAYTEVQYVRCEGDSLGMIWAAIQVELLTYRRLKENDPWISPYFDLHDVLQGLEDSDNDAMQRLVQSHGAQGIKEFSKCGLFEGGLYEWGGCARREQACITYFANLDDWKRTTFIPERT